MGVRTGSPVRQVSCSSKCTAKYIANTFGLVVKLEFTPACQAGGRGFESRRDRKCALAHEVE